jgi:hypothetical protein
VGGFGQDGPVPFVGLAQLFRRDVPGLAAGPEGADLVQVFRCSGSHLGPDQGPRYHLQWRKAGCVTEQMVDPPFVEVFRWEHELPEPCVLHPEEVDCYPWAEEDALPGELVARIDAWEDAQAAQDGPGGPSYQDDLSIPPGWRVGGFPSWASTGPMTVDCASCASPMRLLLTAGGGELDSGSHSWAPLEDRDPTVRGQASILGGWTVADPTRLRFGRDRDLHVFTCAADPGHPPRWVLA